MQNTASKELKKQLMKATIGGADKRSDLQKRSKLFAQYIQKALPECEVVEVIPTNTAAALNSISGKIKLKFPDGPKKEVFAKIHLESNTQSISTLGAEKEYANAEVLITAGWPALKPIATSNNADYPLLLYPIIKKPTLFSVLEKKYTQKTNKLSPKLLKNLQNYNQKIGEKETENIRTAEKQFAINAPVQALFLNRLTVGGRIDQWYTSKTMFKLPGIKNVITWEQLIDAEWIINGEYYATTLRKIIEQARKDLSFQNEKQVFLTISHGDDHAGNVLLTNPPTVFDPAFAGLNPVALDVKALAHTGFLPIAGMYYVPKELQCKYKLTNNKINVKTNFAELIQNALIEQYLKLRFIPVLKAVKDKGGNIQSELQRIKSALFCCALLTINIAKTLQQNDGRAIGLLPMAIMLSQLKGLPILGSMRKEIEQI